MRRPLNIALATASAFAALVADDRLLVDALAERGSSAAGAIWNDNEVRWTDYDAVVIRSCWDYHLAHDAFLAWIARLASSGVRVLNPPPLVRWNAEKGYLRDLAARGVVVVPTRWVQRGDVLSLLFVECLEQLVAHTDRFRKAGQLICTSGLDRRRSAKKDQCRHD